MHRQAVLQIVGYKDSGKTTLICQLIRQLSEKGLRIGTIKHDSHELRLDAEGTDTWKHSEAGAQVVAVSSQKRTAIFKQQATPLSNLLTAMSGLDLILVEGFKREPYPKILMIKKEDDLALMEQLSNIIAVVSWIPLENACTPVWSVNRTEGLAEFLLRYTGVEHK
ncbi:molybdopterin-guanine dinucleotide biosynthesis protein B [Lihuaxuella thermophila]|uniref:Molybdopterin-guanine dinucleotide biosynthesis protein B n=1 Tax=Lihuaxuella thermophila TaxID=1173111 RepID=A0A1H8ACU1_9BACL|nr:molybdopterin-guanine dinucleotide biosynthesis protein B [Lihuaxuella thermophila]SEM67734.1 molybdopterin-guanine dinucleotide biosynthesis protein B [Lihuaxuella thermophila]